MNYISTLVFVTLLVSVTPLASAQGQEETMVSGKQYGMNYYLYTPQKVEGNVPLLLFLHGGGESGDSLAILKKHGPPRLISEGRNYPFFMLAPQNPYKKGFWDDRVVYQLLDSIMRVLPVDSNRIYLAGMSRGGYASWRLAMNNPDTFAAMLVICGASAPQAYVGWVSHIPIWIFHGVRDHTIPVSESIDMVKALEAMGAKVKLTLYPEAGHDAWTETFNNEEVYTWMLRQFKDQ